jgi:predicted dehydrogenase
MNLEFANGALGQLLSSFAAPGTLAPWLELHCTKGTISFAGKSWVTDAPASIYLDDDGPLGLEGWVHGVQPPPPRDALDLIEAGAAHFVAVLAGDESPVLTAEHGRHVLEIMLAASASIEDGASHPIATSF